MNLFEQVEDPTDLVTIKSVISQSERPGCLVPLGIQHLVISPTAALEVADYLKRVLGERSGTKPTVVLLADQTKIFRNGQDLKEAVASALGSDYLIKPLVLGTENHLHADDAALDAATAALEGVDAVVSVGSGTISDIAKVASARQGGVPHVLVQTAASVDGYTDNVSVVLRSGAKRTIPSRWPDVVLADTEVISSAPVELNTSGFGELLSLFTAPADWWLANKLGSDKSFHTTPRDLLLTFAGNPGEWGAGISEGNREAVDQLTKVLAIRGIGTGIAGTTACLSGMEHLVSHMLDMYAAAHHHETGLHGKQVGVASVVAATAWEYLLDQIRAGREISLRRSTELLEPLVNTVFRECDPSGALGGECWSDYSQKLKALAAAENRIVDVTASAGAIELALGDTLPDSKNLVKGLHLAGAACSSDELDDWVTPEVWRWAVSNCHLMRNRVTIVDLLDAIGWWNEDDVDEILSRVAQTIEEVRGV